MYGRKSYSRSKPVGRKSYGKSYSGKSHVGTSVVAPAAVGTYVKHRTPAVRQKSVNKMTISNRELIYTVNNMEGADQFAVTTFPVQPGLSSLFPLLSNQAKSFTRYKMKFCLEFVPSVGTQTAGSIFLAYDRNMNESPPTSVSQLMTYDGASNGNVWANLSFPANRKYITRSEKLLFTRYGGLQGTQDIKLYDLCNIFVALTGVTDDTITILGQVYCSYVCTFYDQRIEPIIEDNVFSFYPTLIREGEPEPIDTLAKAQLNYAFGSGDVVYTPDVCYTDSGTTGGISLIFPSAGIYLVSQYIDMIIGYGPSGGETNFQVPIPFNQTLGANGGPGSAAIVSQSYSIGFSANPDAITQPDVWRMSNSQVVQILQSGSYLVGTDVIVGGGFISQHVDASFNEVINYDNSTAASSGNTGAMADVNIFVSTIDAQLASYFDDATFGTSAPSPLARKTIREHLMSAPIKGFGPPRNCRIQKLQAEARHVQEEHFVQASSSQVPPPAKGWFR